MTKQVLFLDNDFLTNIFRQDQSVETYPETTERFNRIMEGLYEKYDIKITKIVYDEAVIDINDYPKDAAVDNWLASKNITPIQTSIPPGADAGEQSIIAAIEADPNLYNATTGEYVEDSFKIASNDGYFNSGGRGLITVTFVLKPMTPWIPLPLTGVSV